MSCDVLVFTWFFPERPGWLDFRYRVQSCLKTADTIVVSNREEAKAELQVPKDKFFYLRCKHLGVVGMIKYFWAMHKVVKKYKPKKIVFLSSYFAALSWVFKKYNYALYWNEHPLHQFDQTPSMSLRYIKNKLMYKSCYLSARSANPVMPIGEYQYEDLKANSVDESRIKLVYMGVADSFVCGGSDGVFRDDTLTVLYTGTVKESRGRDVMIGALPQIKKTGAKVILKFIGATQDQIEYCERQADKLGVADMLEVHGRVPGDQIPGLLVSADAGICIWEDRPYWRYNPPTKLFEYLAAGLPVLASNIRTHTKYVHDNINGIVFEYDSQSFAAAVIKLWTIKDNLKSMKTKAAQDGEKYLWSKVECHFKEALMR